jgi:hypothetical protein
MRYMSIVIVRMRCFCLLLYFSLKNQYKHHQRQQEYHQRQTSPLVYMINVIKFLTNRQKRKRADNEKIHENYYDHEEHLLRSLLI